MSNVGPSLASVGRFAVLGPGGVGGLLAALLARSGAAVTCLARGSTAQSIATAGIRVESAQFGDFIAPVAAAEQLSEPVEPVDVCLVTVKATQLAGALDRLQPDVVGSALIVPLLNGVEHVELLRQHYPDATVVAATIRVESSRTAPGVIRHDSPFVSVELAVDGSAGQTVAWLADKLEGAGVTVDVSDDAATALWSKLTFLTASPCSPQRRRLRPARSASAVATTCWPWSVRPRRLPAPRARRECGRRRGFLRRHPNGHEVIDATGRGERPTVGTGRHRRSCRPSRRPTPHPGAGHQPVRRRTARPLSHLSVPASGPSSQNAGCLDVAYGC